MGNSPISKAMSFLLKRIVENFGKWRWMCQRLLNALQTAGTADAPQHEANSVLASEPVTSVVVGIASCRRHGCHASGKVAFQCSAYPLPDGRGAWAIAGPVARTDR